VAIGRHAFADSVPMRRPAATPSWTQRPSWISVTLSIWVTATDACAFRCRHWMYWEGAAAPINGIFARSAMHGSWPR